METLIFISFIISIIFSIFKIIESKIINKKYPPIKYILRDAVIVFCSTFAGLFGYVQLNGSITDMMNIITNTKQMDLAHTQVFVDEPEF